MRSMKRLVLTVGVIVCSLALSAQADITVSSWSLFTTVTAETGASLTQVGDTTAALPYTLTRNVSTSNAGNTQTSTATSMYDFSVTGNDGTFRFDFDHVRAGAPVSNAQSSGTVSFSVDVASTYSFAGQYGMLGEQQIFQNARLRDVTAGFTDIFQSLQSSLSTTDQSFVIGGSAGDNANNNIGTTTGSLIAGHDYFLDYANLINYATLLGPDDGGANASGYLEFNITANPIPAPGAALLAMIGLPFVSWARRHWS